jgi:hypothetical protein
MKVEQNSLVWTAQQSVYSRERRTTSIQDYLKMMQLWVFTECNQKLRTILAAMVA